MPEQSQHNFKLGEMADDLLAYTLKICGKNSDVGKGKKTYRFPLYLYPNYVTCIIDAATEIHKDIIIANESRDLDKRTALQEEVMGDCVYLNHLIRHSKECGWISEKQMNKWKNLTTSIYWKTKKWMESDINRKNK